MLWRDLVELQKQVIYEQRERSIIVMDSTQTKLKGMIPDWRIQTEKGLGTERERGRGSKSRKKNALMVVKKLAICGKGQDCCAQP